MIELDLPGSHNVFYVQDHSSYQIIENEAIKTFFPYVKSCTEITTRSNSISVRIYDTYIEVKAFSGRCSRLSYDGVFNAYKIIISLIRENLQLNEDYCYLHGAVVNIEGHICAFLAKTGTGKTTLSVYMDGLENCMCLSDDLIILHKASHRIYPISKYAHLREPTIVCLDNCRSSLEYNKHICRYEYELSSDRFDKDYFLSNVFVLTRVVSLDRVLFEHASEHDIMDNMFLPFQVKNNILSSIQIHQQHPSHHLYYCKLDSFKNEILDFLNSGCKT